MPEQCLQPGVDPAVYEIAFKSGREYCRGFHYMPSPESGMAVPHKQPCVLLAHGFGGTADAGLHPYARLFAESGMHAIIFDYRHFGASEGMPRQLVSIRRQLQDWHAAVAFARSQTGIDAERIVLWGMSLSGGHVIRVADRDRGIFAVIAQFPMLDGLAALRNILSYAGYGQIVKLLAAGIRDLMSKLPGMKAVMIPIVGPPGELAALSTQDAEPGYRAIVPPDWQNAVCARIALTIPFYRPGFLLKRITIPVLVQIADHDTILPPSSIERFMDPVHPYLRIRYYPSGHFDAFSGELFKLSANDQISFLSTALSESIHESDPAQQYG